jgi:hypothetical protein
VLEKYDYRRMDNEMMKKIDFEIAETMNKMADPDLCAGSASTLTRISGYYRPVECWNVGKRKNT